MILTYSPYMYLRRHSNIHVTHTAHTAHTTHTLRTPHTQCTQVVDYAKEAYSRTGHTLLDSIAIVHPFITSTLLQRVESVIDQAGEVSYNYRATQCHVTIIILSV